MLGAPSAPTVKTVVKFEVKVDKPGVTVDDVFLSLAPDNVQSLAALLPGVSADDLAVSRPSTDLVDGACSRMPCRNGAPCFGAVEVYMCGKPLSAMMVLSNRCASLDVWNRCIRYDRLSPDFEEEFAEELSELIDLPAYRIQVTEVETLPGGQIQVHFDILPAGATLDAPEGDGEGDDGVSQEEAMELVENLQLCGSTVCGGDDSGGGGLGHTPSEVIVAGLGMTDVEVVDDEGVGCPSGFEALDCSEDADECASSPCRHGAPCNSETTAAFDMYMCGEPVEIEVELGAMCFVPGAASGVGCRSSASGSCGSGGHRLSALPSGFADSFVAQLSNRTAVPAHRLHLNDATPGADGSWRLSIEVLPVASSTEYDLMPQLEAANRVEMVLESMRQWGAVCTQVEDVTSDAATAAVGCPAGFSGVNCELVRGGCGSRLRPPCQHGGRCIELGDNSVTLASGITTLRAERPVRCDCPDPYYGEYCELVPDACESQPCANGAACLRNGTGFECVCRSGWTGATCSEWPDPCSNSSVCSAKTACVHTGPHAYECRQQPVLFSYVHYHTRPSTHAIAVGDSFDSAFAAYRRAPVASRGYCSALLTGASRLRNQDICPEGSDSDIAFYYSFQMSVGFAGLYKFRMHADWGAGGGFVCFDATCEHHAGDVWGHIYFQRPLLQGRTKVKMLGFEGCCDGHAELEFMLPSECAGGVPGEMCAHAVSRQQWLAIDSTAQYECSAAGEAFECPAEGWEYYRFRPLYDAQQVDHFASVQLRLYEDGVALEATPMFGRFVPINRTMNAEAARLYCEGHYRGLASVHSLAEQGLAAAACQLLSDPTEQHAYGCWIGLRDTESEGEFRWIDGSPVDYVHWADGEPNDVGADGEDVVELDFRPRIARFGDWNDASHARCCCMFCIVK